ncbi:uncharacterized protein LOC6581186 isoform X1 [Drosophila mojavensis]|uniref:Uncharacterized protein, isoform B n=1 Tax=Drosophila mojavensis TaxID=7230 RepID=B4KML9_DROMO|nr:uncharacterized protein LOC6581186 isoform X1 [Drosophila mojavensis]XP_032586444.1 uncharacterized protein LOC6581186 isoform X1 [Drosophila mojavensis]XP_043867276.1 uncharacterized protein LOC6581186 isoform X1 [Drosophila mojavensis]XP_043867277.1 uncharacterized protein LOC6581186 isoform X1 [Drosophila mojavensis]EDW10866.2 uncharacterized protein Dmoj_GI21339, isoform B [Drosophila mojavensis]KRG05555.1 uncharacterized protein Dmoj_GI21339, isoform E [Drosophila mojavensis]
MDDPSIKKRLIDFGTDDHDYDEVQDLPKESNDQLLQSTSQSQNIDDNPSTSTVAGAGGTAEDSPPVLPPPKQKSVKNSKNKQKQKSANKSKIPRSPSLASSFSNLASSISGINNNNTSVPPQTPPLPTSYQKPNKNKAKLMNGVEKKGVASAPSGTILAVPDLDCKGSSNSDSNLMDSCALVTDGDCGTNLGISQDYPCTSGSRSHIQLSPINQVQKPATPSPASPKNFQYLTLTVRKDDNGYGMKVSGDNPVFVESVKPGGAAQIAGLVAGDMILKVNGQEVRQEKHPTVVSYIKASTIVELAVKRSQKSSRPSSVGVVPTTPVLSGRDRTASITGPQPVDSIKRREMETYKIQTLQKMLEQEKLNLDRLKGDTNNPSYKLSEANIRKLREQLHQVGAEDTPNIKCQAGEKNTDILMHNPIQNLSVATPHHNLHNNNHHQQQVSTQQSQSTQHTSPAFLSLLPRSLSSLSLGTRKNKTDKDLLTSTLNNTTDVLPQLRGQEAFNPMSQSLYHHIKANMLSPQQNTQRNLQQQCVNQPQQRSKETLKLSSGPKGKNVFTISKSLIEEDIPPPLPQRNPTRQLALDLGNSIHQYSPISDLDRAGSPQRTSPKFIASNNDGSGHLFNNNNNSTKSKRSKIKAKALSDPKMTTQMFLQMETTNRPMATEDVGTSKKLEVDSCPPPLPPRQPGMLSEEINRGSCQSLAQPNSISAGYNYPLVSTCTAVQGDNIKVAFPLSQRPNIVQKLQQAQQQPLGCLSTAVLGQTPPLNQMKHRRVGSSPDNMHPRHPDRLVKTISGSWEIVEKDNEITPPGTPPPPYLTNSHMSVPEESNENCSGGAGICIESHHFTPMAGATSPSQQALLSSRLHAAQSTDTQKKIISMEDENSSDQEEPFIDENGPFNNLTRLLEPENVVFLAVFLNYVLSNSEPAPLLFYLITELYKEGTSKDMRKWAYEIHSTFLVPRAPLSWYRQDESLAREVDNVLQSEFDKVEILSTVFLRSRKRAKDLISEQLREFQQKRTAGLGTIYGPTDDKLAEAKADKQKEQIIDKYLMPNLQLLIEEFEKDLPQEDARKLALCSALSTVIHRIFTTRSHPNTIVDRVHHFVSREKSFKSRLMGKNRKMIARGHPLVLRQYYEVTHCNHCQTIIWGVSPQGYHCTDCKLNIHRLCSKVLEESCPGPLPQAKRHPHNDNKISKFMGKIRPRTSDFIANEKRARQDDTDIDIESNNDRVNSASIVRQPSDRRLDGNVSFRSNGNTSSSTSVLNSSDLQNSFHAGSNANESATSSGGFLGISELTTSSGSTTLSSCLAGTVGMTSQSDLNTTESLESKDLKRETYYQQHKNAQVSVNRSESYKERLSNKRIRNSRRKTSDPSLSSRTNDDPGDLGLSTANNTGSSSSSLSSGGGFDSPGTSMEQVTSCAALSTIGTNTNTNVGNSHQHPHKFVQQQGNQHSQHDSFQGSIGSSSSVSNTNFWNVGQPLQRQWNFESDDEDLNEADWSSIVPVEMLAMLTDAEKKRQEIINEIYQTERNHVRTLRLLDRLFFLPLFDSGLLSHDHLLLLFPPALISLRDIHGAFEQKLKQRRVEHNHVVKYIGDLLSDMFDGKSGEVLCDHAAQFCARQQIALEALKEKRNKDEQLQKLLKKSESHKACRRLELKDLLPTVLQRLTKYPLLFENLYKVTIRVQPENTTEADAIQRAVESSKNILVEVNKAVKAAEDAHKLQNIQRKLDKSSYDKDEFKKLDLTQHRLVHDGNLTMKKNPSIQLHGLLFENMIVLLTKQDDKYLLKNLHTPLAVSNKPVSPIMNIDSETLVRQEAADKNSFFLIKTKTSQMLELRAPSSSECKTWFKHISDAAAYQYKPRAKNSNSQDASGDDSVIPTTSQIHTRESMDQPPDRSQPINPTAISSTTPLAPLLPISTMSPTPTASINCDSSDQQSKSRGERSPTDSECYYNIMAKRRLSQNEPVTPINRTMSTRSCGESNSNYPTTSQDINSVNLRHTQSAREANSEDRGMIYGLVGGQSKRDSASIVCSNNSNNTRTLIMQSPLVEPTAIQISINPAHTAEPVLTPGERLRRIDASIRERLLEKQRIICDIFRLPVEHFNEIVDIAMMPEAPKDSADIALAAYDQVQMLTGILNDYMHVSPEMEISAVSTAVCDHCREKELHFANTSPPPLPKPKKPQQAQQQTPQLNKTAKHKTRVAEEVAIHEDDDGYCEIDELRLPAILTKSPDPSTPLPPFNFGSATECNLNLPSSSNNIDIVQRNRDINVDLPSEECADKIHSSLRFNVTKSETLKAKKLVEERQMENMALSENTDVNPTEKNKKSQARQQIDESFPAKALQSIESTDRSVHDDINDVYDDLAASNKAHVVQSIIKSSSGIAQPISPINNEKGSSTSSTNPVGNLCRLNRIQHANSLEPSVPCHVLSSIVNVLNEQISLLLPKINERDIERERLRKENQHLRELLSAMHESQRVDVVKETPTDILTILQAADSEFDDSIDTISNTSVTPTATPLPSVTTDDNNMESRDLPLHTESNITEPACSTQNIDRNLRLPGNSNEQQDDPLHPSKTQTEEQDEEKKNGYN